MQRSVAFIIHNSTRFHRRDKEMCRFYAAGNLHRGCRSRICHLVTRMETNEAFNRRAYSEGRIIIIHWILGNPIMWLTWYKKKRKFIIKNKFLFANLSWKITGHVLINNILIYYQKFLENHKFEDKTDHRQETPCRSTKNIILTLTEIA